MTPAWALPAILACMTSCWAQEVWVKTALPSYMSVTCLLEGSGGAILVGTAENGLQRSADGGATWFRMKTAFGYSLPIPSMVKSPSGEIFLTDGDSLIGSADNGDSWQILAKPPILGATRALAAGGGGVLYAGGVNGICRSGDAGRTWKHTGLLNETVTAILIRSDDNVLLGCAHTGGQNGGVYRSETVGSFWSFIGASNGNVISLGYHGKILFAGLANGAGENLVGAEFGGTNWYSYSRGLPAVPVHALAAGPDGSFWAGTGTGLYQSRNGGMDWNPAGLDGMDVRCILLHSNGTLLAGTDGGGLFSHSPRATGILALAAVVRGGYRGRLFDLLGRGAAWNRQRSE